MYELIKSDWKKYREKIGRWQENYMERLLSEYVVFLQTDEPASKKFWELEKKIKQDKKHPGVLITNMSKSSAVYDIVKLVREGVVQVEELKDFSEELQEAVDYMLKH